MLKHPTQYVVQFWYYYAALICKA